VINIAKFYRSNARQAQRIWGNLPRSALQKPRLLAEAHTLNLSFGELQYIDDRWYITHAGLLGIAKRNRCAGIKTAIQKEFSDPVACRWVFKAIVYTSGRSNGFVGYGDADPSNVSPLVRGAEMRVAETRAVNRERPHKQFRLPLGGAEHHNQTHDSRNVRKILDTTHLDSQANTFPELGSDCLGRGLDELPRLCDESL